MVRLYRAASCLALLFLVACGGGEAPLGTVTASGVGPAGDSSGDPTDGVMSTAGTDTAGTDHGVCDTYLACVAAATPDALPTAETNFGPDSPCWMGSQDAAELCLMACEQSLAALASVYPDEPACGGSPGATTGPTDGTSSGPGSTTDDPSNTTGSSPCDNPQPNGSPCNQLDCACLSGKCYVDLLAMTTVCGECVDDDDCPGGGCSAPVDDGGSFCNAGELGQACESNAACGPAAPLCLDVYENNPIPGLPQTCSECASNADCPAQTPYCAPVFGAALFEGYRACAAAGTVPNDGGCPLAPGGGAACASGFCNETYFQGLPAVGLCGECSSDGDCGPGETCKDGQADKNGMKGATCV